MENGSVLIRLPNDFPHQEVIEVSERVLGAGILVPGFVPPPAGLLNPFALQYEQVFESIEHYIFPDRNLASRIAHVGLGEPIEDSSRILAASVMALAQCLNINFEPSVAFHELAALEGNEAATDELSAFFSADEISPQHWIDLALARPTTLPYVERPKLIGPPRNLAKPLHRWRRNYVIALKIAELELSDVQPVQKVRNLLEWMHEDFMIGGPALLLAALYFSPARGGGIIKGIRSPDRNRTIAGVRNVAWDMTHLSEFLRRVHENDANKGHERFMFATLDKELARVGKALFHLDDERDDLDKFSRRLSEWWRPSIARDIAATLWRVLGDRDALIRRFNREPLSDSLETFTAQGEERVKRWFPR